MKSSSPAAFAFRSLSLFSFATLIDDSDGMSRPISTEHVVDDDEGGNSSTYQFPSQEAA